MRNWNIYWEIAAWTLVFKKDIIILIYAPCVEYLPIFGFNFLGISSIRGAYGLGVLPKAYFL